MYWVIDAVAFFAGIISILSALLHSPIDAAVLLTSLCWIWVYPLALEGAANYLSRYCREEEVHLGINRQKIVYREEYNISIFGMEKCHSFDSLKYGKIY